MKDKPTCVLCGYPSKDYVVYRVPLTSRPETRIVCVDCIDDLRELAAERSAVPEECRVTHWVIVFDCAEAAIVGPCSQEEALAVVDPLGCRATAAHPLALCVLKKDPWMKDGLLRCDLDRVREGGTESPCP